MKLSVIVALMGLITNVGFGQQLPGTSLYKDSTNGTAQPLVYQHTVEAKDSVTVGAVVDYFVMPDNLISPSYNPAVSFTSDLNSSFAWTIGGAGSSTVTKTGMLSNYITATWTTTPGSYTLVAKETATTGTCPDNIGTTVNSVVIAKPTASFSPTTSSAICSTNPAADTLKLPLVLTTSMSDNNIRITYTITGATTKAATPLDLKESATSYTLPAGTFNGSSYGVNTITITQVSDRISRKSGVTGTITTNTYTFTINRTPSTGAIYHLPNN
jgi:hypothetical protein